MTTEIQLAQNQERNDLLAFPSDGKRFKMNVAGMKWKEFAKNSGITDETSLKEIKEIQKKFMNEKRELQRTIRSLSSALVSDDRFKTINLSCWEDKKGEQRFSISATTALKKERFEKSKEPEEMSIEELEKLLENKRKTLLK